MPGTEQTCYLWHRPQKLYGMNPSFTPILDVGKWNQIYTCLPGVRVSLKEMVGLFPFSLTSTELNPG